ncbi:unnamed protein product [Psylliodes chrysocephalus]|uniref:DUF7869 domain-containing protein n=1 Tax=Psylliodes chrysocephalus TaxID=3402493 RepID=A0A9P0CE48_9CUCU|nr:unnamed protein product [Psylliodes chrysocephala]
MENSSSSKILKVSTLSARSKRILSLLNKSEENVALHGLQPNSIQSLEKEDPEDGILIQPAHSSKEIFKDISHIDQSSKESEHLQVLLCSTEEYEVAADGTLATVTSPYDNEAGDLEHDAAEAALSSITIENKVEIQMEEAKSIQGDVGTKTLEKKTRKRKSDFTKWEINVNKQKRMKGEEYKGLKKSDGKWSDQPRKARQIKPFCNCKHSRSDTKIKCNLFTEEERLNIFKRFWQNLNWEQRKTYVSSLVDTSTPKDKKNLKNGVSRRDVTFLYYLKKNGIRVRVCKKMFNNTLNIGEWSTHSWVLQKPNRNSNTDVDSDLVPAQPQVIQRKSDRFSSKKDNLKDFFHSLPKLESHYCRASSQRLYLEPIWQSKLALYGEYVRFCQNKQVLEPLSTKVFYEQFYENKLSLYRPRKDQCDICVSHKSGNMTEDDYLRHINRKDRARQEKDFDKENATHIFTVDMQSVLLCPMLKASSIYYKKKLVVHNYTIYNLKTKDGFCFLWHEGEGGVTSNEFATILYDFIENKSEVKSGEEIIIFSDGCGYQNRNVTLTNALLHLSKKKKITIIQKYLVPGHTQMECDSMHSTIERKLRNQEIYTPAGYLSACKSARRHPKPYSVEYLRHTYFKDYSKLSFFTSIRPGVRVGDATVNNLCALKYTNEGLLYFKTNFNHDWLQLIKRNNKQVTGTEEIPQLYNAPLAIKKSKYEHLQDLKKEIPHDFHLFYETLQYQ